MEIEVICTGDEVLTGKIVNSNFSHITQKLEDSGLSVRRGITVGDDREELLRAFQEAGRRSDVVIVNGGLGPTVDDLSQEIAAKAAGVELELHEEWLARMEGFFQRRGRDMPVNNRKQAMLPAGAEVIDNPIGTACGFGLRIGKGMFYFTPGVPRELFKMLEEQLLPRMLEMSGRKMVIRLRRFHSFGLGESHVDQLLQGIEELVPDGSLKLGFRAHYPQLETKLTVRAETEEEARAKLAPAEAELYRRIGNFILCEDDQTLEGVILALLEKNRFSLAVAEDFTGGQVAARLAAAPGAENFLYRATVAMTPEAKVGAFGLEGPWPGGGGEAPPEVAEALAAEVSRSAGASHGLVALCHVEPDVVQGGDNFYGSITVALAWEGGTAYRRSRLVGTRDWVRLGAVELALDSLRRHLQGLPIKERIDFEKTRPGR